MEELWIVMQEITEKLPASMSTNYHQWVFENHRDESAELIRELVI